MKYMIRIIAMLLLTLIVLSCNSNFQASRSEDGAETKETKPFIYCVGKTLEDFEKEIIDIGGELMYSIDEIDSGLTCQFLFRYNLNDKGILFVNTTHDRGVKVINGAYLFSRGGELVSSEGPDLISDQNECFSDDEILTGKKVFALFGKNAQYSESIDKNIYRLVYFSNSGKLYDMSFGYYGDNRLTYASCTDLITEAKIFEYHMICESNDESIYVAQFESQDRFETMVYDGSSAEPIARLGYFADNETRIVGTEPICYSDNLTITTVADLIQAYGEPIAKGNISPTYEYLTPRGLGYVYISDNGQIILFDVDETETIVLNVTFMGRNTR